MINTEAEARAWLATLPEWNSDVAVRLETLIALLHHQNTHQNLVSAASLEHVWRRHIVDSAQLLTHVSRETTGPWLDLGTGAGFPGVVISVLRPDWEVIMVESRARRVAWLELVCRELGLGRAQVEGNRLEHVAQRPVCVISARAFAPLPKLLDLSARFSTSNTVWVLPKGRSAQQELDELSGWHHLFHVEQSLTDPDAGIVTGRLAGKNGRKPK